MLPSCRLLTTRDGTRGGRARLKTHAVFINWRVSITSWRNSVFIHEMIMFKACFHSPRHISCTPRTSSYPLFPSSAVSTQQTSTYSLRSPASTFPQVILKSFCSRRACLRPFMVSGVICTIKPSVNKNCASHLFAKEGLCLRV